jgi:hypothetical protein
MAKVIKPFRDRITWVAYDAGDEYDGTPERIAELAAAGIVEAPKPKPARTRKAATRE